MAIGIDGDGRIQPNVEALEQCQGLHNLLLGCLVLNQILRHDSREEAGVFVCAAVDDMHHIDLIAVQVREIFDINGQREEEAFIAVLESCLGVNGP